MIEASPHQPSFLGSCSYSRGTEWSHGSALCGRLGLGANPGRRCLWRVSLSPFLPAFTLALVFCLLWVHSHCSGIVYFNTVAPKRTDLCMQIPKLWETEATQSFVRVNCFFFFFWGVGCKTAKLSIFPLKFRDFWSRFLLPYILSWDLNIVVKWANEQTLEPHYWPLFCEALASFFFFL